MTRTRSLRWLARRSASTLPAKPAPTISQSYMIRLLRGRDDGVGRDGCGGTRRLAHGVEHELVHGAPGLVPGTGREMPVAPADARLLRPPEQDFGLADRLQGCPGDLDEIGR